MRVAITGGTGFVGSHLAKRLTAEGHEVVIVSRRTGIGLDDGLALFNAFRGCDAVAHLAGINREIGDQTYEHVHVKGTANVIEAAKTAGVQKIILLSFLRARPCCGSAYHESKSMAECLVRQSGLDYTIFKAGVIYGRGDHMLDHIAHALYTFPIFLLVGFQSKPVRPLAVDDLADVMVKCLVKGRLSSKTVPITGPEEMDLREAVARIMRVTGKHPLVMPAPVWLHYAMAWFFERTMAVPLAAKAQVRILSEGLTEPVEAPDVLPMDLIPRTRFTDDQIRRGLPEPGRFGLRDCLWRQAASRLLDDDDPSHSRSKGGSVSGRPVVLAVVVKLRP